MNAQPAPGGANLPLWLGTVPAYSPAPAPLDDHVDVAIVGGGIAGIATAYFLRESGLKVAVLEARRLCEGVTGHTTGKLTSQHGASYGNWRKIVGDARIRAYAEANEWAIQFVRSLHESQTVACDFGEERALTYGRTEKDRDALQEELEACLELGLPAAWVDSGPERDAGTGALAFERQARMHPAKLVLGLAKLAEQAGVVFHERTRVVDIDEEEGRCNLRLEGRELTAGRVVVATNYPIHDSGLFVARLAPYRAYAIAARLRGPVDSGMFISVDEPATSWRPHIQADGEWQIIGGGHHRVGQIEETTQEFAKLERWARDRFDIEQIDFRWSTQDNWTPDYLPYVGRSPNRDRIFVATGFCGWGMTNGLVSGRLLSALILQGEHPWADVYDPRRTEWAAAPKLFTENIHAAKHLVGDKIRPVPKESPETLAPGEAKIIAVEEGRMGAYRDSDGVLHRVSVSCPHMGCQVAWNDAEKTWDCPCHGSRFSFDGDVLHGPATVPIHWEEPKEEVPNILM